MRGIQKAFALQDVGCQGAGCPCQLHLRSPVGQTHNAGVLVTYSGTTSAGKNPVLLWGPDSAA